MVARFERGFFESKPDCDVLKEKIMRHVIATISSIVLSADDGLPTERRSPPFRQMSNNLVL
jgi:hypothetical protein